MKKYLNLLFILNTSIFAVIPYYSIRSQGENAARELVGAGWNTLINRCHMDNWYGNFSITTEYTRSFEPTTIGKKLFGYCGNRCCPAEAFKCYTPCCCPFVPLEGPCCEPSEPCCTPCCVTCCDDEFTVIHVSGSQALNRMGWDWFADYFGLPTDFKSCLTFQPVIDNFLVDFNLYIGLDRWLEGLYFKIDAPLAHSRWALHMCEIIENRGTNNYWPGYFNNALELSETDTIGIERSHLANSFSTYISGCPVVQDPTISYIPLQHAKITCNKQTKTAFADIQMALGYNFFCDNDYHAGFNIQANAPTGNSPTAHYLFEPIVGNGKHWQAGIGFSAHVLLGCNEDETKRWEFYGDANITHLFETKQCRTFDLCSKPLSRYMLAAEFSPDVDDLIAGDDSGGTPDEPVAPSGQFIGAYSPVANLTTFPVNVSVSIQADLALMLQYVHNNWSIDIGYNFWMKTCEDIKVCSDANFTEGLWALKGDAFMYGFKENPDGTISPDPVALSATQSGATIYDGANNWPNGTDGFNYVQNPGVDNRKLAWDDADNKLLSLDVARSTTHHVFTSLDPQFISFCDIDIYGARTQGSSNKIFFHVDYTWCENHCFVPYIGIGGELEFGYDSEDNCGPYSDSCIACGGCSGSCACLPCMMPCGNPDASNCQYCPLSQWGIWIKGGTAF